TVDEYGVLFRSLFSMDSLDASGIRGIVISSVVPPLDSTLRQVCERYFKLKPLFIEPGVKTGMPVHYENPAEVGADRIVNGVADDRDRLAGGADRDRLEVHQTRRRLPDARRTADHLGTQPGCEARQGCQACGRDRQDRQAPFLFSLSARGKLLQLLHRN